MNVTATRLAGFFLATMGTVLAGCQPRIAPKDFALGAPIFRPEVFFAGRAHSWGVIETGAGAPRSRLAVESSGALLAGGELRLDQTIEIDQRRRARTWIIRHMDAHRYTAALTDAAGPVQAEAWGNLFHLRYALKDHPGATMEQWLYLQPDGRTVLNEGVVRVLGFGVARVSELITREGSPVGEAGAPTAHDPGAL